MKVSVSLAGEDVEFLDAYARAHAFPSRSAVVKQAIQSLRLGELPDAYGHAWDEWETGGEGELWERTAGDGLW
jgi:Arc/MetJ-type ribon-helix-helix transcriptional regulator